METVNLEKRLDKFNKFKNLKNFGILGGNGKIELYYSNELFGHIIYNLIDIVNISDYELKDKSYFPVVLLLMESIAFEVEREIFFNNCINLNDELSTFLKKINYTVEVVDGDVGYYLDLTDYNSFADRFDYLNNFE